MFESTTRLEKDDVRASIWRAALDAGAAGRHRGERAGLGESAHARRRPPVESKCNVAPLLTTQQRAEQSGASVRTQKMADKVARADPELALQVAHGEITLPQATEALARRTADARTGTGRPVKSHRTRKPRPVGRPKKGPNADAMREELAAAAARGVSMLCTYARLTLGAIQAQTEFTAEEHGLLAQIGRVIHQLEHGVLQHEDVGHADLLPVPGGSKGTFRPERR